MPTRPIGSAGTARDSTPSRISSGIGSRCAPVRRRRRGSPRRARRRNARDSADIAAPARRSADSSVQRCAGQRLHRSCRAVVVVGVQLVADPACQHHTPATGKPPTSPGARSARSGTGCHAAAAAVGWPWRGPGHQRLRRDHRRRLGSAASAATTSIDEISGAAARIASSTASSSVTADDGQLLQLPANCSCTVVADDVEQVHVAAVRAQIGPDPVECILDPAFARRAGAGRARAAGWPPDRRRPARSNMPGSGATADAPSSGASPRRRGRLARRQLLGALARDRPAGRRRVQQASGSDRPLSATARLSSQLLGPRHSGGPCITPR